ncbi:cell division protein FtsW [Thermotomaculum hydrothermale]|uniref:Cell division protein FtsW n=1 Tax=Thermotomaculum hydrothermale TaxID=981385 RepID=A0A7R6SYM0_9BACT|nr:FtsW/RodA/SpoVE family cell cycle protein [Thermotomaculum hydrothermale]BBB32800.1 cell division protein FtsW [Thermotomaculum hydrothermale]
MNFEKLIVAISTIVLTFFGLLLNASIITTNSTYFFKSVIIVVIGLVLLMLIIKFFKYEYLLYDWIYAVGGVVIISLLIYILIAGKKINGAQRWLFIGPFSLQVSEFAKLYVVILVSYVIYKFHKNEVVQLIAYLTVCIICALILFEPDLGMSFFIFVIGSLLFFIAGLYNRVKIKASFGLLTAGILVAFALYFLSSTFKNKVDSMKSYQLNRIERFRAMIFPYKVDLNISKMQVKFDPITVDTSSGYSEQSLKVKQAIENATWLGSGLSQGYFTKYLPAKHNDYIAVLALEELGIVGISLIGLLFLIMFFAITKISFSTESVFVHYITLGIAFVIFMQALLHFGVNFQVFPEKGISLPLVSYGGSSYISNIIMIALVMKARVKG